MDGQTAIIPPAASQAMPFDSVAVRSQFPILARKVRTLDGADRPIVYLDHGASTHAPRAVLDTVQRVLTESYANIHRGNHRLSLESSDLFDGSLRTFLEFVGADPATHCAVVGQNTTMALDLAAHLVADRPGATLATFMEHHSNLLPHRRRGEVLHAEVDAEGRVDLEDVERRLDSGKVRLLAVSGASNVTGHTPPIHRLARMAHDRGALILVDAAQLLAHRPIDMKPDGHPEHIDLLAAAGHKAYAPLGSAFLVASRELLDAAPPYMPGGGTVEWVGDDDATYTTSPDRHMGGTPNIVGTIALAAALRWLDGIGMGAVQRHEHALTKRALKRFAELEEDGVVLLGPRKAADKVGVFSFVLPGVRHELVSAILDHEHAIATRNGCFCAQPLLHRLLQVKDARALRESVAKGAPMPGASRATLGIYNTEEEVDILAEAVRAIARRRWKGRYDIREDGVCHPREAALKPVLGAARKSDGSS
jgi:cysteine desulfurase / selenocysteine lyase